MCEMLSRRQVVSFRRKNEKERAAVSFGTAGRSTSESGTSATRTMRCAVGSYPNTAQSRGNEPLGPGLMSFQRVTLFTDFIAWLAGKRPHLKTIFASYSDELGVFVNMNLQRIMTSERY